MEFLRKIPLLGLIAFLVMVGTATLALADPIPVYTKPHHTGWWGAKKNVHIDDLPPTPPRTKLGEGIEIKEVISTKVTNLEEKIGKLTGADLEMEVKILAPESVKEEDLFAYIPRRNYLDGAMRHGQEVEVFLLHNKKKATGKLTERTVKLRVNLVNGIRSRDPKFLYPLSLSTSLKKDHPPAWRETVAVDQEAKTAVVGSPKRPRLIYLAGGPGSGKTSVRKMLVDKGILKGFTEIDPDAIKETLPGYSHELAGNFHMESIHLALAQVDASLADGKDVIVDTAFASPDYFDEYLDEVRAKHPQYEIGVISVTTDIDTALQRVLDRAKAGGRGVPPDLVRDLHRRAHDTLVRVGRKLDWQIQINNNGEKPKFTFALGQKHSPAFLALVDQLKIPETPPPCPGWFSWFKGR